MKKSIFLMACLLACCVFAQSKTYVPAAIKKQDASPADISLAAKISFCSIINIKGYLLQNIAGKDSDVLPVIHNSIT